MLEHRLKRLAERQRAAGIDCVTLMPGPNMQYLSGLTLFMSERPVLVFLCLDRRPALLVPALERGRAEAMAGKGVDLYSYTDEEGAAAGFARVGEALRLAGKSVAVEYLHMRVLELRALEAVAPGARFVALEDVLPGLRIIKDQDEVDAMRKAIAITEDALWALLSRSLVGLSERDVANRLAQEFMAAGAQRIGFLIVVAGPNGADPHAGPSDRPLQAGDLVTIDCGVTHDGYPSDITRTFAVGEASPELKRIYDVVRRANEAGKAVTRPGIEAQEVDRAARKVIADAGYGQHFIHRTGHGLGLEGHEPPYMVEGNAERLEPGMVFTVEPGVYIPGLGGVRIEDNLVVTASGFECLTHFPRELMVIS